MMSIVSLLDEKENEPCEGDESDLSRDYRYDRQRFRDEVRRVTRCAVVKEEVLQDILGANEDGGPIRNPALKALLDEGSVVEGLYV